MKRTFVFAVVAVLLATTGPVQAQQRDTISIVGSSTVYPFATVVAEKFGKAGAFKTPKIESTGTGGGFKLFCGGVGVQHPDITNASRAIKASEFESCGKARRDRDRRGQDRLRRDRAGQLEEGARRSSSPRRTSSSRSPRRFPIPRAATRWCPTPTRRWKEINPALPDAKIEVLGPPPTSGTRDAFVELVMEHGAESFAWLKASEKERREAVPKAIAHPVREDGAYIEAGENDSRSAETGWPTPVRWASSASAPRSERGQDQGRPQIEGQLPTFEAIADGKLCGLPAPCTFTLKSAHGTRSPACSEFLDRVHAAKKAWAGRRLSEPTKGLSPMPDAERWQFRTDVKAAKALDPAQLK